MPPDRGAVKKTPSKSDNRKDSKLSSNKDSRTRDSSNVRAARGKQESKLGDASSRRGEKSKTEEAMTSGAGVVKRSKIDSEKLKDVKHDINKDLRKAKETLSRNRTTNNVSQKQPAKSSNTPVKASSEVLLRNRMSTRSSSVDQKKVSSISSSSKKVPHSSTKYNKPDTLARGDTLSRSRLDQNSSKKGTTETNKDNKHSKTNKVPQKLNRERTRTRTLSPHEVKIVRGPQQQVVEVTKSQKSQKSKELPHTTSRDDNVGTKTRQSPAAGDSGDSYEDDFEDYESDFEEDIPESSASSSSASEMLSESDVASVADDNTSDQGVIELSNKPLVEEEKKLDSGNYDLSEGKRKGREMQLIKEALQRENASISSLKRRRQNLGNEMSVSHDEGFEDGKTDEHRNSVIMKKVGFINFANAKKRMEEQKVNAKTKKRSEELLQMITLDVINFSLLDLPPVPYDVFMKSYGRSNTQQASVQTNEDYLSEETQTEEISSRNMWTQHPLVYRPVKDKDGNVIEHITSQLHVEVGGDKDEDPNLWKELIKYDAEKLNEFLLLRGQRVLKFLERKAGLGRKKLTSNTAASSISSGYFSLGVESASFLKDRPVTKLCFCSRQPTLLLTVHSQDNKPDGNTDTFIKRCMICIWNVMEPSSPEKILVCSEEVSSACFHSVADYLVFAGLCDGTVCVWDLHEAASAHRLVNKQIKDWVLRSPTYSTAEILKDENHLTKVVAIQPIVNKDEPTDLNTNDSPIQVSSVDMSGIVIIWTAVRSSKVGLSSGVSQQDLGLAHWGRVRLVRSISIKLFEGLNMSNDFLSNMACQDMHMDPMDETNFYVCTNSGHTLHCLITGYKPHPKVYFSSDGGLPPATCIECIVDHHLLVGFEGGTVRLYCRGISRPIATFAGTGDVLGQGPCIRRIQWSPVRPCQFFILDRKSRIHVWNLSESDIHSVEEVDFKKNVLSMALSPFCGNKPMYLVVGTAGGEVELYEMKSKFCYKSETEYNQELEQFKFYAKSL